MKTENELILSAVESGATISSCGAYRYHLWRRWSRETGCTFVMLNPSTANATDDDPTIRRCIGYAKRLGHGSLEVVNLFARRATNPKELNTVFSKPFHRHIDVIGPDNEASVVAALARSSRIIAAWGSASAVDYNLRWYAIRQMQNVIKPYAPIWCLHKTADGSPGHPLYLKQDAELQMYLAGEAVVG